MEIYDALSYLSDQAFGTTGVSFLSMAYRQSEIFNEHKKEETG
jgi:hypothetical protein